MRLRSLLCSIVLAIAATGASAARPVLIEEFTGTWCGYCYAAGRALDRIEAEYPRSQVVVVAYHIDDDFAIVMNSDQQYFYNIGSFPTACFNGYARQTGGYLSSSGDTGVTAMYNKYKTKIQQEQIRIADINPLDVVLTGNLTPNKPKITLTITAKTGSPYAYYANILITEEGIPVSASNGQTVLNAVVRAGGYATVSLPNAGDIKTYTLNITTTIACRDASKLQVVGFVQKTSGEIVAATGVLTTNAADRAWSLYE